jgi:lipopolysaccharide/colanic/teichoic acid biosynthesis glycosyltransferase
MKRVFDLVLASLAAALLAPLMVAIAAAILLRDGRPVFFRQQRVGQFGRPFRMWKFRTMVRDAEARGGTLTVGGDPRITPLGRWLRRRRLDELPQLVNVLRGEMSLVGPRPETPDFVAGYTPEQREVLRLKPGVTDVASIAYRREGELLAAAADPRELYRREIAPRKIEFSLAYARQANVLTDLGVLARTAACVFEREAA